MANATTRTNVGQVELTSIDTTKRLLVSTAQTYYPGELLGMNASGYVTKLDDTASLGFIGVCDEGAEVVVPSGASAGDYSLLVSRPRYIGVKTSGAAITDVGRTVYAAYNDEVSFSPGTYGNVIGTVHEFKTATRVIVKVTHGVGAQANREVGAATTLAATGTVTLTKFDLNKTIFCPNTAGQTVNLPAVALASAGDRLTFVKTSADAAAVTLDGNSSETIDGATTLATIDADNDTAVLVTNGSEWVVLSRDIA